MDCVHPLTVKVENDAAYALVHPEDQRKYRYMEVPCGVCIACRIAKTREWTLRLMMEKEDWDKCCFITLTYDDDHLPLTKCENMTLFPSDLTKFWKRARKSMEDQETCFHGVLPPGTDSPPLLRYYACGEYGDLGRPHYHAAVFGEDYAPWYIATYKDGKPVYTSDRLKDLWPFGNVTVGSLERERCQYVAGYVQKKIFRDPQKYWDEYGCRVWPFQRQSQGIGYSYYLGHKDDFEARNWRPSLKGVSYSMPRYMSKKDECLKQALSIIGERQKMNVLRAEQDAVDKGYDIYASDIQREKDLIARSKLNKRSLA